VRAFIFFPFFFVSYRHPRLILEQTLSLPPFSPSLVHTLSLFCARTAPAQIAECSLPVSRPEALDGYLALDLRASWENFPRIFFRR